MRTTLITLLFIASSLYATSLEEIISKSLDSNPSLESITKRISANKEDIELSKQFANPELAFTKNSINSNQAMSQTTISFKQKIPYFGKRDTKREIAEGEENVLSVKLFRAKVALVGAIKKEAYKIWELKELYSILQRYEVLTKQNIDLHESYTSTENNQHMGIMSAELTLSDLKIQRTVLKAKIVSAYARLSYLASFRVKNLDIALSIESKPSRNLLQKDLVNNPAVELKDKEILKQNARVKLAKLNHKPDFSVLASYSNRVNFDDYVNLGFGVSLPIYGSEDMKEQKQRELALSLNALKEDTNLAVNSSFDVYFAQMMSDYEVYHIIKDEALPQVQHMFELSNSSVSAGADLFKYIDILVQKLKFEQKSIKAVASYNISKAEIEKLTGKLK